MSGPGSDWNPVIEVSAGTLVQLPEEYGDLVGIKAYSDHKASYVLLPGRGYADRVSLPLQARVRVVATPMELANAYLTKNLEKIDRRCRPRRRYDDTDAAKASAKAPANGEGGGGACVIELRHGIEAGAPPATPGNPGGE